MAETAATTARLAAGAPAPRAGSVAVRRGAYYLLLTGVVGGAYLAAAVLFTVLQAREVTYSRAFPVFFSLAVLVLFNPLRTRLQAFIDRVFFRTRYDGAQVLAAVGAELAATLKRERIVALVCDAVDEAIPNTGARLHLGAPGAAGDVTGVPSALLPRLARGEVLSAVDPAADGGLAALGAALAVPLELRGELVGVLTAGRKRDRRREGARRGAHGGHREGPAQLLAPRRGDAQAGRSARRARGQHPPARAALARPDRDPPRLRHPAAGRVRPRAGEPGIHEPARQRVRRDPRARQRVDHDACRGRAGARHHSRRRGRHDAGDGGPHLRPVLHHQGRGWRDGARARHQPRCGRGPRRADRGGERAGQGGHLPRLPPARAARRLP